MLKYIQLIRVHEWIKNIFIFAPVFFVGKVFDILVLRELILLFICFSLISSAIYVINDYLDIERDKLHPKKKKRPLASGAISKKNARIVFIIVVLCCLSIIHFLKFQVIILIIFYFVINVLYSLILKHVNLVDIMVVSSGFLLRVYVGGIATDVTVSHWLVIMTFLFSLLIVCSKRRSEIVNTAQKNTRKVLKFYNLSFLDHCLTLTSAVTIVAYILYTLSDNIINMYGDDIYITSFFVFFGILRYMQVTFVDNDTESPTSILFKDRFMQIVIIGWTLTFTYFIYA